jgi:ectoine hydroxylase-related dioxygenase (phytanoyl-CoA dioxygenase family)
VTDTDQHAETSRDEAVALHVAELQRQGYSLHRDALSLELCDEVLAELEQMTETWGRSLVQSFHGHRTIRYFDLLNAAPIFERLPVHEHILPVVRAVLGHDCLLSTYGTVAIGPGEPAQAIHADDILYRLPRPHATIFCNVMIALTDFTEANGATRIVPGSHAWDEYPEIRVMPEGELDDRYPSIAAEMPKGSVCFFLGTTYHGGGANHTDGFRTGITMAYCAGWLRPQENFAIAVAQERAAMFDPELRALMGWRAAHSGALGHIYTQPRHLSGPLAHTIVSPQAPQADLPPPRPAR